MPVNPDHAFADGSAYARPAKRFFPGFSWGSEQRAAEAWRQFDKCCLIGNGCLLGPEAWCVNSSGDPHRITLADRVVCRGLLRIEKFGRGKITIGSNTYIGDDCLLSSAAEIAIGENVLIAHGVQIFDNDSHPVDPKARLQDYASLQTDGCRETIASAPIRIASGAWIGFNAILLKGITVGENSIVAAGSVVTKDVPANTIAAGNPAVLIKSIP